jgi:hypothetical protein
MHFLKKRTIWYLVQYKHESCTNTAAEMSTNEVENAELQSK